MTAPLKVEQAAAERLLTKAVRRAVEMLRADSCDHTVGPIPCDDWPRCVPTQHVEAMLRAAGESAELLLGADR